MNTNIKHKIIAGAMLFGALLLGASCEDSDGLKVTPETPFADKTMFEVIKNDATLTDFVEVLDCCGPECADSLFNHARVYTLWAPMNGSFNKDSIIEEINAGNRDEVFKTFIMAHISNHLKAANGNLDEDNKILLLNKKVATFAGDYVNGYTFSGSLLVESNIRVWNGILHKISTPAEYKYSLWEYMRMDSRVDSVSKFLYSFNVTDFDPRLSTMGPIVDGAQTYIDSVFTTTNDMLTPWDGVGNLDAEDSLYVLYVPTNEVWNEMVAKADRCFNYNRMVAQPLSMDSLYRDSLRYHYARLNVIKYMTYSNYEQRHVENYPDSIMPAYRRIGDARRLFAMSQLENNVIFSRPFSNGVFKIVGTSPFTEFELWHDTIVLEGENEAMCTQASADRTRRLSVNDANINKDSIFANTEISEGRYLAAESDRSRVTVKFKVPDLLSASYNVAIVVVPKNITSQFVTAEELLPTEYNVTISQNTHEGVKKLFTSPKLYNDPTRVDTMYLTDSSGERAVVTIPYCEFFESFSAADYNVELVVQSRNIYNKKYDQSIRIDAVIFEPVETPEE